MGSDEMQMYGDVELLYVDKKTGDITKEMSYRNLIVNEGKEYLAHRLCDTSSTYNTYKFTSIRLGYNNAAPAVTDVYNTLTGTSGYAYGVACTNYDGTTYMRATSTFDGNYALTVEPYTKLGVTDWWCLGLIMSSYLFSRITVSTNLKTGWGTATDLTVIWTVSYS